MKRKLTALCVALCLALCACGEPPAEAKAPYDSESVKSLLAADIFSEGLEEIDTDIACKVFGVDGETVDNCQAYLPTSTNAEALVLFVLNDEAEAGSTEDACRSWLERQIDSYRGYGPEHVPKLEGAVLSTRGSTVLLVVGNDPAAAQAAVDALE